MNTENNSNLPAKKHKGIVKEQLQPIDENITRAGVNFYLAIKPPENYNKRDPIQMQKQLDKFIQVTLETGVKVGNMSLYTALGINHRDVPNYLSRNDAISDIVKKGKDFCAQMREFYSANGELNPVLAIFWQKNYDALSDKQEITVNTNNNDNVPITKLVENIDDLPE